MHQGSELLYGDEDIADFWRSHSNLEVGLIDPSRKHLHTIERDASREIELFSSVEPNFKVVDRGNFYLLTQHEEQGNKVWSVTERAAYDRQRGYSASQVVLRRSIKPVHSLILTPSGELFGERHYCVDIYNRGTIAPTRAERDIQPLNDKSWKALAIVANKIEQLRDQAYYGTI